MPGDRHAGPERQQLTAVALDRDHGPGSARPGRRLLPARDGPYLAASRPADDAGQRIKDSAAYLGEHMGEVPVLVLACIEVPDSWTPGGNQAGLWGSLLPAAWSYMLACRSRGLGTAWTTLHLRYEAEVAELLGLPHNIRQGVLIPTAYYTGETFRPAPRRALPLHENRWLSRIGGPPIRHYG